MDRPHTPASLARSPKESARRFIEKIAVDRLDLFKASVDTSTGECRDDPYAQIKSLSEHIAADYEVVGVVDTIATNMDAQDEGEREFARRMRR